MTRLARWILLLAIIFAVLIALITRLATLDPAFTFTFRRDPSCQQPCWHRIELGRTTIDEAFEILRSDQSLIANIKRHRDENIEWQFSSLPNVESSLSSHGNQNNVVEGVWFGIGFVPSNPTTLFTLADAVQIWGLPIGGMGYYCTVGDSEYLTGEIFFAGNIQVTTVNFLNGVGVSATLIPTRLRLRPELPVDHILYYDNSYPWVEDRWQKWHGFREYEIYTSYFNDC